MSRAERSSALATPRRRDHTSGALVRAESRVAWTMLLPVLIVVLGAVGYPLLRTLYLSFTGARLTALNVTPPWVGLQNYVGALTDPGFQAAAARTSLFVVASVGLEVVLGVLAALLLNQQFVGRAAARALLIVPLALPTVVNAIMWRWIYNPEFGALNALLTQLHLLPEYRSWLGDPASAMTMLIIADVWKNFPLVAIVALAALQLVPKDVYEAAAVDGARAWVRFWRITWPGILPVLSVAVVLRTIEAVKVFDIVYVMTRGGPADSTKTLSFLVYEQSFGFLRTGVGASYAYLMVCVSAVLIALYLTMLRRQAVGP
jgi:multiple sugar transport system permease protein